MAVVIGVKDREQLGDEELGTVRWGSSVTTTFLLVGSSRMSAQSEK
jgi:hypothetical protein